MWGNALTERPEGTISKTVSSLAELHLADETLDSIVGHIGRLGVEALDGWDAVGTTLVEGRRIATFGINDERVNPVDQMQYDTGAGPCVDAMKQGETHYFDGSVEEPRWRDFAQAAADAGVYSVVSFPLRLDDEVIGALNFYSSERDALRQGQLEEGWLFAGQAAVAISNAKEFTNLGAQVEQLKEGLQTRAMIGQATGLLMAQEGLTSEEAFQKLVSVSQHANVKLRDIAERYVHSWEEKAKTGP
jgi:GAF domain-containing protein